MEVIGVLSDTHLREITPGFRALFKPGGPLSDCTMVFHAGDFTSIAILDYLENHFHFHGAQGNMDDYELRGRLPIKKVVTIEGVIKIGITHGWGAPVKIEKRVYGYFNDPSLDCIVFGHSHIPKNERLESTLMFNPGSFKGGLFAERSVGKLYVEGEAIRGEIIKI